jgi:hypothetical protein
MRHRTLWIGLLAATVLSVPLSAISPQKVVDKYRAAVGGKAVKAVRAVEWSGTAAAPDGRTGAFCLRVQAPDRYRLDVALGESRFAECYNGKSAWRLEAAAPRTLLGEESAAVRLRAVAAATRLGDLSRHGLRLGKTVRTGRVDGRAVHVVDLLYGERVLTLSFDATSSLLLRQEARVEGGVECWSFADYRRVGGVLEPHAVVVTGPAGEFRVAMAAVRHNPNLSAGLFRFPDVSAGRPLPDPTALLREVSAHQEQNARMREQYTFKEARTIQKLDGSGRVKETEDSVYDVTPVNDTFVERLIAKSGKPLSPKEQAKEDERVTEEVDKLLKDPGSRKGRRGRGEDIDEDPVLVFLRAAQITSLRREALRGQEVIAFDFEPRADFKPRTRTESLLGKLAGTIWVDEAALEVARVEARLTDKFKMGGGLLASVSPNTRFVVEQQKVAGEVWLPFYTEGNIAARVLLLAGVNIRLVSRFSDYQKVQVKIDYAMPPPRTE